MIRYKIEVETRYSFFFIRKEYYSYSQALKARRMINFSKYSDCVIRIYQFENDIKGERKNLVIGSMSKN